MSEMLRQLRDAVNGRTPLVYIYSPEEERVLRGLKEIASEREPAAVLHEWSCLAGLDGNPETRDAVVALQQVVAADLRGLIIFKDLAPFMDDPLVARALREAYQDGRNKPDRVVFLLCAENNIPESLKKEMQLVEVASSDETEIAETIATLLAENPHLVLPKTAQSEVILALKGLTENEICGILLRACSRDETDGETDKDRLLDEIFAEKKNVVKKSGFLEFSPPRWRVEDLGGLDRLKEWLVRRERMFSREALAAGVPIPKGLLMMGVSGCGKSLAVKTISALWNIPMFRLDMNLVFSGLYGSPEEAFHRALKTIESVAPAVLWIDEIENALGLDESGQRIASHIFSAFLTWMQEKPPLIFIAATANKIQALPAEVLRKGRFDEVFFCDLPAAPEREDIFRIHLKRTGANFDEFDFKTLQILTEGWNGAEIEQAVVSARTEAFYENRALNQRDLSNVIGRIVPLSETMEQQIKSIRSWAFSRATPASKYGKSAAKTR